MVGVYEEDDIRLSYLFSQDIAFVWLSGGVDDCRCYIFRSSNTRRDGNLRKDWLYFACHEDVFNQRSDEAGFAGGFIPTDTYPD